jgi:hypothetical protein
MKLHILAPERDLPTLAVSHSWVPLPIEFKKEEVHPSNAMHQIAVEPQNAAIAKAFFLMVKSWKNAALTFSFRCE